MKVLSLTDFRDYCSSNRQLNYLFEFKNQKHSFMPMWFAARYSNVEFVFDSNTIIFSNKYSFMHLCFVQYIEIDEITHGYYKRARIICLNPNNGGTVVYDIMITV